MALICCRCIRNVTHIAQSRFKVESWSVYSRDICVSDRLHGLVVRVPGYRSRDPGFDSQRYQIFRELVALKRSPLSLVSTIEELL
jgi:hypothetical protein